MTRNPVIAEYTKTAKVGTWQKLQGAIQTLRHIRLTTNGVTYNCDFSAKTEGAFFVIAEGATEFELLVVFPDDAKATFDGWYTPMTEDYNVPVVTALQQLVTQNALAHGNYSGLDEFVEWFDREWSQYGGSVDQLEVTICGYTLSGDQVPAYSNANHDMSTWLLWARSVLLEAGAEYALRMQDIQDENSTHKYKFPVLATNGEHQATITIYLCV